MEDSEDLVDAGSGSLASSFKTPTADACGESAHGQSRARSNDELAHVEVEGAVAVVVHDEVVQQPVVDCPDEVRTGVRSQKLVNAVSCSLVAVALHRLPQDVVPVRNVALVGVEVLVLDLGVESAQLVVFVLETVRQSEGVLEFSESEGVSHVEGCSSLSALDDGIDLVLVESSWDVGDFSVALLGEQLSVANLVRHLGVLLLSRNHGQTKSGGDLDRVSTSEADVGLSQNIPVTSCVDLVVVSQRIHFGVTSEVHRLEAVEGTNIPTNMRYGEHMRHMGLKSSNIRIERNILTMLGAVID